MQLAEEPQPRGLHSSTFRLNVSAFCVTGVAFSGCLGVFRACQVVSGGIRVSLGCVLSGCMRGYEGVFRMYFVSGTAQGELQSGRV